jgi:hypothetical protein
MVYAAQEADGSERKLPGDIFVSPETTSESVGAAKLLAPFSQWPKGLNRNIE